MDKEKIESLIYQLLEALGEDPNREGLLETPKRVAQMMEEVYEGIQYTNAEIAEMYGKTFAVDTNQMVVVKDITCFSHCEHHMALMYDMTLVSVTFRKVELLAYLRFLALQKCVVSVCNCKRKSEKI